MEIELGNLLRTVRLVSGYSQREMARVMNTNRTTISKLETGVMDVKATDLFKWTDSTQGQDMLITYMQTSGIITNVKVTVSRVLID